MTNVVFVIRIMVDLLRSHGIRLSAKYHLLKTNRHSTYLVQPQESVRSRDESVVFDVAFTSLYTANRRGHRVKVTGRVPKTPHRH